VALVWDKALFDEMYSGPLWRYGVRNSTRVPSVKGYYRATRSTATQIILAGILAQPGFAQVSDVAVIGGAFGWLAEALIANGVNAVTVDTSSYVLANQGISEEQEIRDALTANGFDPDNLPTLMDPNDPNAVFTGDPYALWTNNGVRTTLTVLDEDLANNGSRNRVRNALPGSIDAIITEFLLDIMETDAESLLIASRVESLAPNPAAVRVHIIADGTGGDPRLNHKTKEQWRALLDANGFSNHVVATASGVWI
jgi:hypothetical protein